MINYSNCTSDLFQNFRQDYCRFGFSLLENLEDIETLSECQEACEYVNNCSYFVYDSPTKICKLNTMASNRPVCDIIHGTPEPDFNTCVNDGQLDWASNETNTQSGQSTSKGMKVKRFSLAKPIESQKLFSEIKSYSSYIFS